jgi:hypothetical protein
MLNGGLEKQSPIGLIEDARHDLKVLTRALRSLPGLQRTARRNQDHLDHFTVALEREINTRQRLLLADRVRRACTLGEHLWAGGGFQYVDQRRNAYALSPGHGHGLMQLRRFPIPKALSADALRIRNLGEEHFNLFAATWEEER